MGVVKERNPVLRVTLLGSAPHFPAYSADDAKAAPDREPLCTETRAHFSPGSESRPTLGRRRRGGLRAPPRPPPPLSPAGGVWSITPYPIHIRLLRPYAIVLAPDPVSDLWSKRRGFPAPISTSEGVCVWILGCTKLCQPLDLMALIKRY